MLEFEDQADFTERERWAFSEARQCQKVAAAMRAGIAGWTDGAAERGHHPDSYRGAYESAIKAQAWEEIAWRLRRPYHCRKERENEQAGR